MEKEVVLTNIEVRSHLQSALERLEKQYDYCLNQSSDQSFFAGLISYFEIIANNKYLSTLVNKTIYPEEKACEDNYVVKSKEYRTKLEAGWKKIEKYLQDNKLLSLPPIVVCAEKVNDFLAGRISVSGTEPNSSLECDIEDTLRVLRDIGHIAFVKKFGALDSQNNVQDWYWVSKEASECSEAYKDILEQQENHAWGSFSAIRRLYHRFIRSKESGHELKKQGKTWDALSVWSEGQEIKSILAGKPFDGFRYYKREKFNTHLNRVHNRIISDAESIIDSLNNNQATTENIVSYIPGQITINSQKIPIRGFTEALFTALFSLKEKAYEPQMEDDLLIMCGEKEEDLYVGNKLDDKYRKKIWRTAKSLQKRLSDKYNISDLLVIPDTYRVGINPRYKIQPKVHT